MKICFVTTGDIKDIATSKRALGMANPLAQLGWEVHILLEDAPENRIRVGLECSKDIHVHYYPKCGAITELRFKNRLIHVINPDFLYLSAFVFRNIVVPCSYYKKIVEHSELQSGIPDIKGLKKRLIHLLEYFSVFYADGLVCASRYLEKVYTKKMKFIRTRRPLIYHPYAYSESLYKPKDVTVLAKSFQNLLDKNNIVFLGSITRNYGAFDMLETIKIISKKRTDIRLILLGKGRHYDEALRYVADNKLEDTVLLPGFVAEEDIAHYFSIATAFLSPMNDTVQDWARCPSKLYMYLPFKRPIVSCRIGEPYQVLGNSGYYYQPGNSKDMAITITKLIDAENYQPINPELHTWGYRTNEFNIWITKTFLK
jgi:glycosyltransferase involved in cell wall biosynthesis